MEVLKRVYEKAKRKKVTIVLPEGEDRRVQEASVIIVKEGLASLILLGRKEKIGISHSEISIIDPRDYKGFASLYESFSNIPKYKNYSQKEKEVCVKDPIYFGCLLLKENKADGVVGGATTTTAHTVRAALSIIGVKEERKVLSSFFLMILPHKEFGEEGCFLFADCGVVPRPNEDQLLDIASATCETARDFFGWEPRVAFLSFSTKGSAQHMLARKVASVTARFKQRYPYVLSDGELQLDAAVVPDVALRKAPDSPLKGKANILIFPDLNSGNIAYKLTQRFAKAQAFGPILQGLNKPVNDLSRGCSVDDIVNVVAITSAQVERK